MSTRRFTATSTWTKIAEAGTAAETAFPLRNVSGYGPLLLALGDEPPNDDDDAMEVYAYEGFHRALIPGALWVKASSKACNHMNQKMDIDFILMV